MIKNQWYGILESKEVSHKKPVGVTRFGEKLVLFRDSKGVLSCLFDRCCHRGASLSKGWIEHDQLVCPFHGFQYNASGRVTQIPAIGKKAAIESRFKVNRYAVKEKQGFIWLWYGDPSDATDEIPFFEELTEGFTYGGFSEVWPVHYTRAIENQLDVVHLPFVHANTIGRGGKTLVNGPVVEWEGNRMNFYVDNERDDGLKKPKKSSEILNYKTLFKLQLQMPNLWQNIISDEVRIVAVFAPIDETNTKIYLRFYQRFMKWPVLSHLINYSSRYLNRYILHQDRRVVITQLPKKTELKMGENLIAGDAPIIEYRKKRAYLKANDKAPD